MALLVLFHKMDLVNVIHIIIYYMDILNFIMLYFNLNMAMIMYSSHMVKMDSSLDFTYNEMYD